MQRVEKGQQLWQRVQRGVEKIRILEISPITRFLVLNWLKPRREGLVPFCGERSHVSENALHLLDANVPREWDCIQTRSALPARSWFVGYLEKLYKKRASGEDDRP